MGMSIGAISLVRKCSVEVAKNMKYITTRAGNAIARRFFEVAYPHRAKPHRAKPLNRAKLLNRAANPVC